MRTVAPKPSSLIRGAHAAGVAAALSGAAAALAGPPFSITWYSIDAGGAQLSGDVFTLHATIGQPDAGPGSSGMSGDGFTLVGGFEVAFAGPPPCNADFNHDGAVTSQDFFDYLNAFFGNLPAADFNADGSVNSQDFFDFLTAFFSGC
jgi:hypothetical protein